MPDRHLRCFCCGQTCNGYKDYKDHIFNDHADEEGNMWLKCPHCEYPVRDLKAHYKTKHPELPLPKVPQMKARVWKEWDKKRKKMARSKKSPGKRNWTEGYFLSPKNGHQQYRYRSSWELYVMECLDDFEEVLSWQSEPFPIPYQLRGRHRMYIPDFIIQYKDNSTLLVEVKPKSQCSEEMNLEKWKAAKIYCDVRRWKFEVWTENYIVEIRRKRRAILQNRRLRLLNPGIDIL